MGKVFTIQCVKRGDVRLSQAQTVYSPGTKVCDGCKKCQQPSKGK